MEIIVYESKEASLPKYQGKISLGVLTTEKGEKERNLLSAELQHIHQMFGKVSSLEISLKNAVLIG